MYSFNKETDCPALRKANYFSNSVNAIDSKKITDMGNTELTIFLNPASGKVFISFYSDRYSGSIINIMNIKGETVNTTYLYVHSSTKNIEINMEDLSDGMYFIK